MDIIHMTKNQIQMVKDMLSGKIKTVPIDVPKKPKEKESVYREIDIPFGVYERMKNILFAEGTYFKTVTLELILAWVDVMETRYGGRYPQRGIGLLSPKGKEPKLIHPDATSKELKDKGYCNSTDLSKMFNCSRYYIGDLARSGKIGYLKVGKRYYFTQKNIDDFLASNTITS
jgi:hypothetical protein